MTSIGNDRWEFASPTASLRCGGLAGRVDVACPHKGVHDLNVNSSRLPGTLFAAEWISENQAANTAKTAPAAGWPMQVSDAYVRGGDLVATYGRLPNSHYAPQMYLLLDGCGIAEACCLSLVVSIQTDLLDSQPWIRVTTRLAADELIRVDVPGSACLLWRLTGSDVSYAEIVSERDFRKVSLDSQGDGQSAVHWDLFAEFLEKGVIRRAQINGVFLPRAHDIDAAGDFSLAVSSRPLPLTT